MPLLGGRNIQESRSPCEKELQRGITLTRFNDTTSVTSANNPLEPLCSLLGHESSNGFSPRSLTELSHYYSKTKSLAHMYKSIGGLTERYEVHSNWSMEAKKKVTPISLLNYSEI